jgi:predicted RNA-binding protein with PIN domain
VNAISKGVHYWIDGYNLLFRLTKDYKTMRAQERSILLALNQAISHFKYSVTIVLDGREKDPPEAIRRNLDSLALIYTPHYQTADDYILEAIAASSHPEKEMVISSDLELLSRAKQRGAHGQTIEQFLAKLTRKKKKTSPAPDKEFHETSADFDRLLKEFERRLK